MTFAATMTIVALVLPVSVLTERPGEAGQAVPQLERAVKDKLGRRDLKNVEVSVQGSEALLSGRVPHFWAKHQAIERVLEVELPTGESDADLAEAVAKEIQRYAHYTQWDDITANVNQGTVFLGGWATPDRDKAGELFEKVAKITGVQNVESTIENLSPSRSDRRIRQSIERQLRSNMHFEHIINMKNPPLHIIVNNGHVRLVGYVQGQIEMIEIQRIVAQTKDVLRVQNDLQTIQ
jgi:osmotically-inducible protein OsmY